MPPRSSSRVCVCVCACVLRSLPVAFSSSSSSSSRHLYHRRLLYYVRQRLIYESIMTDGKDTRAGLSSTRESHDVPSYLSAFLAPAIASWTFRGLETLRPDSCTLTLSSISSAARSSVSFILRIA
mmetsp:Transcript_16988/g.68510  ORF Transcript_16988/g.68510 Transcript_16988/m.68510 type:complete len:125 (-) Transcript_16988:187-561(-)